MMANLAHPRLFINRSARSWTLPDASKVDPAIAAFHRRLPGYSKTPLVSLDAVAKELGVGHVLLKDESQRLGLPSFKILGASWATFRAVTKAVNAPLDVTLEKLSVIAQREGLQLFAATDGNHGRAVARMARLLGIQAHILVPQSLDQDTQALIASEGAQVKAIRGDYDLAVQTAESDSKAAGGLLIQDTAWQGYEEIPEWVINGYSTMMHELDEQMEAVVGKPADLVVVPVGVGSLAQAVVKHYKGSARTTAVLAVEPDTAACLRKSLTVGAIIPISTGDTIMQGMNCGTVSTIAWPLLRDGLDACTSVSDIEAHRALQELDSLGVKAGPCGAAPLAAVRSTRQHLDYLGLDKSSVVVLLCTEGTRGYEAPLDVSPVDPVILTQQLVRIDSSNPDLSEGRGGGEKVVAEYVAAWLAHRGFDVHRLEKFPGRTSIVGVAKGTGGGKSLMFNGHIDTVTLAGYKGNPLSGDIVDDAVHGRGAYDMKAGVAASLVAAAKAKEAYLRGDIIVAAVADEENASIGTEEVLEAGWRADGAIVSEPSNLEVTLSHRGFVWFDVDIIGKAAHGSRPELGIDAIVKAGYFLVELERYGKDLAGGPKHPALGTGTVHASLVKGGEERSSYPALCTVSLERRTVPGEGANVVEAQLRAILDGLVKSVPDFRYRLRPGLSRPAYQVDQTTPIVKTVLKHVEDVLGRKPTIRAEPFWTDAALLAEKGTPALLFGVDGGGAHAATEWATVDSIHKVAEALTRIVLDFCA